MALPKKKHSRARRGFRRAHHFLNEPGLGRCPSCHATKLPHRVCPACGYYRDRHAVEVGPATEGAAEEEESQT